jgi:predicted DNA-binding protein with PD1-like motif
MIKALILFLILTNFQILIAAEVVPMKSSAEAHVLRLTPGEDPRVALLKYVRDNKIKAASIVSAVGSLKTTVLRYANQKDSVKLDGFKEVVSMSGTLSSTGGCHLHVSVSDSSGITVGGHLVEGSQVYTTFEVVLLSYPELEFSRVVDPKTTFEELAIKKSK